MIVRFNLQKGEMYVHVNDIIAICTNLTGQEGSCLVCSEPLGTVVLKDTAEEALAAWIEGLALLEGENDEEEEQEEEEDNEVHH